MLKAGVTIGCSVAMLVAAVLVVRLSDTRRVPPSLTGAEPFGERLAVTVSRASGMLAGAIIAGLLTIGAGGRLLMRVLAATSSEDAQGRLTDADEVVGEVSVGGSLFLIVGLGIGIGVVGLAGFLVLRRWLPDRSVSAGLIGVAIGAGLLVRPSGLLNPDNEDFALLSPVALAVGFCLAMLVLFGATFGVLVDRLAPGWPRPGRSVRGVASVLPFAVLLLTPPLFVAAMVTVVAGAVVPARRSRAAEAHQTLPGSRSAWARGGHIVVSGLGALGALSVLVAAGQVLAV